VKYFVSKQEKMKSTKFITFSNSYLNVPVPEQHSFQYPHPPYAPSATPLHQHCKKDFFTNGI
jgi:hypothetical protein